MRGRGRRGGMGLYPALMLVRLFSQIAELPHKPPVALLTIAFCCFAHFAPPNLVSSFLPGVERGLGAVCLQPKLIVAGWHHGSFMLTRWLGSGFLHANELHLVYNMGAFLVRGVNLELDLGSRNFAIMVLSLLVLSHTLIVICSMALVSLDFPETFRGMCAVGFSAVGFGLKYVGRHYNPHEHVRLLAWDLSGPWATACELVLVQLLLPQASFLGHLMGILAGALFVQGLDRLVFQPHTPGRNASSSGAAPPPTSQRRSGRSPRYTYASGTAAMPQQAAAQGSTGAFASASAAATATAAGGAVSALSPPPAPSAPPQPLPARSISSTAGEEHDEWVDLGGNSTDSPLSSAHDADSLRRRRLQRFE
jgi:membrane associated rhomboid family serine protease